MKTEEIKDLFNRFESIVCDYNGVECWSARELQKLLGYSKWDKFQNVIEKEHIETHTTPVTPCAHSI